MKHNMHIEVEYPSGKKMAYTEGHTLTQQMIREMQPKEKITVCCTPQLRKYNSAYRTAYYCRNTERKDGLKYKIKAIPDEMKIEITLIEAS